MGRGTVRRAFGGHIRSVGSRDVPFEHAPGVEHADVRDVGAECAPAELPGAAGLPRFEVGGLEFVEAFPGGEGEVAEDVADGADRFGGAAAGGEVLNVLAD
jgi:hypothetical protein